MRGAQGDAFSGNATIFIAEDRNDSAGGRHDGAEDHHGLPRFSKGARWCGVTVRFREFDPATR